MRLDEYLRRGKDRTMCLRERVAKGAQPDDIDLSLH
jgi:hypothetical protein